MKEFQIAGWSYQAERPNETDVQVDVIDQVVPGIARKTRYEFTLTQRFELMSDEFMKAVKDILLESHLLD